MSFAFQRLKLALGTGFDWATADVQALLLDADGGFAEDPTLDSVDALTGELATTGYARQATSGRTVERDDGANLVRFQIDDVVFPDLGPASDGPTVGGVVLFVNTGDDSDSWPAVWIDFTGETNGTDFTVSFDADGAVRLRAPA